MRLALALLVIAASTATARPAQYSSLEEYAAEALGPTYLETRRADLSANTMVGVAYTSGRRGTRTCCPPSVEYGEKAGVVSVFKVTANALLLIDSSKVYEIPWKSMGDVGVFTSDAAPQKGHRFAVSISCQWCAGSVAGRNGGVSVRYRFALRRNRWILIGSDRDITSVVGSRTIESRPPEREFLAGVVQRVSHNYLSGRRVVWTYASDKENTKMVLMSRRSTLIKRKFVPLRDFDPRSDILRSEH